MPASRCSSRSRVSMSAREAARNARQVRCSSASSHRVMTGIIPHIVERSTISAYRGVMGIHRLNHAVLYVSDLDRSVAFYRDVLGFRPIPMTPDGFRGAAFLQAPDSTNDHDLGLFEVGRRRAVARRSGHGRPLPPGLGGRHARRAVRDRRAARRRRRPRRLLRPRHHQEPLRQGPRRARVRDRLADPGRPARRRRAATRASGSAGSTSRPRRRRYGGQTRGGVGISVPA